MSGPYGRGYCNCGMRGHIGRHESWCCIYTGDFESDIPWQERRYSDRGLPAVPVVPADQVSAVIAAMLARLGQQAPAAEPETVTAGGPTLAA